MGIATVQPSRVGVHCEKLRRKNIGNKLEGSDTVSLPCTVKLTVSCLLV
jgi:hypothetical protein